AYLTTGNPACRQACSPPARLKTSSLPLRRSKADALPELTPLAQQTSTGLFAGSSPARFSRSDSGMLRALGRWPAANSAAGRTSTMTAPVSLIRRVAPSVSTVGPALPRMTSGHSSIAPETSAMAMRTMFSTMNCTGGPERSDVPADMTYKLVLLRHGQSQWNLENRFTGWTDVDLTPEGLAEARRAGQLLKAEGFDFDIAFTSVLKRAIRTLWTTLDE